MKKTLILLTLCIMASMTSCAQNGLKNGVYELATTPPDSIEIGGIKVPSEMFTISEKLKEMGTNTTRTLFVKNDTVLYRIGNDSGNLAAFRGTRGNYFLNLQKKSDNLYKSKDENIELTITIMDNDTIEIEVFTGIITYYYNGGRYFELPGYPLPPEKQTLTFVRELTAEDKEKLKETQK